ncbi:MAG: Cytochrome oxidase biosis protein Sco1/SenC/PrrC, putative copper metallochaperone [Acidobacteria bacterium]|nr:Cytochrome oxidase biosis protein Sco1/SenC/PrrC, putative copper metallochaperone [Acidobacteriota bacterium]
MTLKWRNKLCLGGLLVALGLNVIPAWAHLPIPPKKGEFGRKEVRHPAPSFTLTDQNGKLFHFKAASGRLVLVNFIYTSCPDVCPLFTANLASIQRTLEGDKQSNYTILSIATDPGFPQLAFSYWFAKGPRAGLESLRRQRARLGQRPSPTHQSNHHSRPSWLSPRRLLWG